MSVNFNESFKALVREVFQEKSDGVIHILDEVVSNKASEDTKHIGNLKDLAIKDIKSQIATNDFVRAEIAESKMELKQDIAVLNENLNAEVFKLNNKITQLKSELKQDIASLRAEVKSEIADLRAEVKQDIAVLNENLNAEVFKLDNKITQLKSELKQDNANLRAELKQDIAKSKVDIIKWLFGLQLATFGAIMGLLRIML